MSATVQPRSASDPVNAFQRRLQQQEDRASPPNRLADAQLRAKRAGALQRGSTMPVQDGALGGRWHTLPLRPLPTSNSGGSGGSGGSSLGLMRAAAGSPAQPTSRRAASVTGFFRALTRGSSSIDSSDDESSSDGQSSLRTAPSLPRTASGVNKHAAQHLNFTDPALLRGTPITRVLHRRAKILGPQDCTAEYYRMSEEVDHIDAFVSHNWSTSRASKFLTLAYHFNLDVAVVVSTMLALVPFFLEVFGKLYSSENVLEGQEPAAIGCQVVGMVAFVLALFFWHEVSALVGFKGPRVFLDKTCVHQTDAELKRQGIQNIAAFLQYSWSMVALYSDIYLEKLWTVYEIASFFMLFPRGHLYVRPVFLPKLMLPSMFAIVCVRGTCHLLQNDTLKVLPVVRAFYFGNDDNLLSGEQRGELFKELGIQFLATLPFSLLLGAICRWWAIEQASIHQRLQGFCIHSAKCQSEEDRKVVEDNVAIFATHFGFVPMGTRKADTLNMFDSLVHEAVPRVLRASLGPTGIPYRFAFSLFIVYHFQCLDVFAVSIHCEGLTPRVVTWTSSSILSYACVGPLGIAFFSVVPKYTMRFRNPLAQVVALTLTSVSVLLFWLGSHASLRGLLHSAHKEPFPWGVIYICCGVLLAALTYVAYRPLATEQEERRLDRSSCRGSGLGLPRSLTAISIPEGSVLGGSEHRRKLARGGGGGGGGGSNDGEDEGSESSGGRSESGELCGSRAAAADDEEEEDEDEDEDDDDDDDEEEDDDDSSGTDADKRGPRPARRGFAGLRRWFSSLSGC